ncbi:subclass B1 metallo-beta-lactamase [Persicitalea jodogahamensis]|uniref:beta-lactamase n=1 Tax=Persicitalea jodogahamensis TaxID=402147 RepID=A0A8J3DB20_9BACT|nr:subclass B1 metallo-beta-lactamase [Persicitalea jodogahamensis]GHB77049.1 beta-lactamase [Persicitalea jodogahamensis]
MTKPTLLIAAFVALTFLSCQSKNDSQGQAADSVKSEITQFSISGKEVYNSENLIVNQISGHTYQHISFLDTDSFGRVACNGMVVVNGNEAVVFDTPTDDRGSQELIDFLAKEMGCQIKGVVATHFHADCVGGIDAFHQNNIPSYASERTIEFLKLKGSPLPKNSFNDSLALEVGDQKVYAQFIGEGHTKDNVIGYSPTDRVLFGGCLIKEIGATKGNLEDANVAAWPETARKVKSKYPQTFVVIPGHGKAGGQELFDFTATLFEK